MKKFIAILVGAVLTLGAIALTSSCQKDINNAKSLIDTKWMGTSDGYAFTLTFISQTKFEMRRVKIGDEKVFTGTFVITGNQTSLKGSDITLAFDGDWTESWHSGSFVSDTEMRLGGTPFRKL